VVCLGDSFDDAAAADALDEVTAAHLTPLMAGRAWIWIEGNHDPGPLGLGGTHRAALRVGVLVFRHIADPAARVRFRAITTPRHGSGRGRDRSRGAVSSWTTGA
jgi:metallophosphoesterase superfamily enzyme